MEGNSDDPVIVGKRIKRVKNYLITLMVSQGAPMFLGGDELLRTQLGNNNAYCQDNEVSWYNWSYNTHSDEIGTFLKRLIHIRKTTPCLRRKKFFSGDIIAETGTKDVHWFTPEGKAVSYSEWTDPGFKAFSTFISGLDAASQPEKAISPDIYLLFNAGKQSVEFTIPDSLESEWEMAINSFDSLESFPRKFSGRGIT
ncbi:glycogen debranching enzyme GlgX, partial [mine drainage metagenome]